MTAITAQNKSELGMNRNDFYEYKKNRMVEMVKNGAGVPDIAVDLGIGEKDVYSFISRNFGGLRNLKSMVSSGLSISQIEQGVLADAPQKRSVGRPKKNESNKNQDKIYKSPGRNKHSESTDLLEEKQRVIDEFKNSIDKDIQMVVSDILNTLDNIKQDLLGKFKSDLMNELSGMVASL